MNFNDIIKVHIWQLPEKINNINKKREYAMIHDGSSLKKVTMERLYEYFNQDYKSENLIRYFDEVLNSLDQEYQLSYSTLDISLSDYENIVKELQEKFKVNRDDIRRLEVIINKLDKDISSFIVFEDINNRCLLLISTLDNFSIKLNEMKITANKSIMETDSLNNDSSTLLNTISDLENSYISMVDKVNDIKETEESYLENSKETLLKNINDEYDKILAIVDHYHHIHDTYVKKSAQQMTGSIMSLKHYNI